MNNSISDWNLIVPEDKILKKIDNLNKKLDNINFFQEKIDKLDNSAFLNELETKIDNLEKKLNIIDEKIDNLLKNNKKHLDFFKNNQPNILEKSNDLYSFNDLYSYNDLKKKKFNNSDYFNPENYSKNIYTNFIFPYSLIDNIGIKGIINDYKPERIKNKLWRKNVINNKSSNYYTTTPYMKF